MARTKSEREADPLGAVVVDFALAKALHDLDRMATGDR
jgi:hypothetical protein